MDKGTLRACDKKVIDLTNGLWGALQDPDKTTIHECGKKTYYDAHDIDVLHDAIWKSWRLFIETELDKILRTESDAGD